MHLWLYNERVLPRLSFYPSDAIGWDAELWDGVAPQLVILAGFIRPRRSGD